MDRREIAILRLANLRAQLAVRDLAQWSHVTLQLPNDGVFWSRVYEVEFEKVLREYEIEFE